jgi:Cys-tRNA(Pro)/Cys-tRNA(Cys) deacylase
MGIKTNAIRLLESAGIKFSTHEYAVDPEKLDAESVASALDIDPERVFKTLVAEDDAGTVHVFCVPGNGTLDLKKAAEACSAKKMQLIPLKRLEPLTGYIHGGGCR